MSMDEDAFHAAYFTGRYDQMKQTLDECISAAPLYADKWRDNTEIDRVAALLVSLHHTFTPGDHLAMLAIAINYLGAIEIAKTDGVPQ